MSARTAGCVFTANGFDEARIGARGTECRLCDEQIATSTYATC